MTTKQSPAAGHVMAEITPAQGRAILAKTDRSGQPTRSLAQEEAAEELTLRQAPAGRPPLFRR
jgi:hypothetical protein